MPDDTSLSPIFSCSPAKDTKQSNSSVGDVVREFLTTFKSSMTSRLRSQLLHHIFKLSLVEDDGMEFFKFVNSDFLTSSLNAMRTLCKARKHNLIYYLSKCFENSKPRMPLDRMPYGLLDYNIRFFASHRTQKLGMEEHYSSWLETMFSQFGHKWLCLHRGPAWQYDLIVETEGSVQGNPDDTSKDVEGGQIDIIQSALQQSSLSLELEEGNDTLDLSSSTLCTSPASIPIFSSPITDETEENAVSTPELCEVGDLMHISDLWNSVPEDERREMELGLVSSQEMERLHSIQPTGSLNAKCNPWMFDPMKVGYVH